LKNGIRNLKDADEGDENPVKETLPEFNSLCEKADRYFADGDNEKVLAFYRKALDLIEGKDDFNREKLKILSNIGNALVRQKQFVRAVTAFKRAADISTALGDKNHLARQMGNIGSAYRDMEKHDSALHYYRIALTVFEEIDDIIGIASQCSNIAYIYAMKGESRAALEWFELSKTKFEASGNHKQAALTLQNIETIKSVISNGK